MKTSSLPLTAFLVAAAALPAVAAPPISRPWNQDVMYFALTDRFHNGDPSNDEPPGSDPALLDRTQTNIDLYHGGDLRGLEQALASGYFTDLGVTALWITPPVRNVWYSAIDGNDAPKTGYHGYWAQDFLDIDPHLVSRRSLDGKTEYPDSRDGRMQHYKDFVELAHSKGIKIVQDIVCNHAGPVFYYDANGNGQFDRDQKTEWVEPFKADGHYDNARWAETPKWDEHRTAPGSSQTILGHPVKITGALADLESYGRKGMSPDSLGKSDGEEVVCDFFGLRDFWTDPSGKNFDRLVDDFVEVYAFYVEEIGVDGFRIDTVKHVHHAFWDAFTERLRKRLGPERAKTLFLFGEVYDTNPAKVGEYTYRLDWPANPAPCLDATLNFPFCYGVRSYLRPQDGRSVGEGTYLSLILRGSWPARWEDLREETEYARHFVNFTPGADGLNSAEKIVNFIENHDGLNRFRVSSISERRNLLANALLLLSPGIPCLYYGSEVDLQDTRGKVGPDAETGRLTFVRTDDTKGFDIARRQENFKSIAALCKLRCTLPALTTANTIPLLIGKAADAGSDGVFAFARVGGYSYIADMVIVVINADNQAHDTTTIQLTHRDGDPFVAQGAILQSVPLPGLNSTNQDLHIAWKPGESPKAHLKLDPESVNVYRLHH